MTQEEYEERLRALEAQLQADVAMVHAGHEARVRSLESLWQAAKAGGEKAKQVPGTRSRPIRADQTSSECAGSMR